MTTTPVAPNPVGVAVTLVSGRVATVMNQDEADWFNRARDDYMKDLKFTETTDLRDMDRLLIHELMVFRWSVWLSSGVDYVGDMIDERKVAADLKQFSDQINKIKESMGLNKKARDAAASEGNFTQWISDLKARGKIFGVHRQQQLTKALALFNELSTIVSAFERSDKEERIKLGFETERDIIDWVRDVCLPEYYEIDKFFQEHEQRYWIREL